MREKEGERGERSGEVEGQKCPSPPPLQNSAEEGREKRRERERKEEREREGGREREREGERERGRGASPPVPDFRFLLHTGSERRRGREIEIMEGGKGGWVSFPLLVTHGKREKKGGSDRERREREGERGREGEKERKKGAEGRFPLPVNYPHPPSRTRQREGDRETERLIRVNHNVND